MGQGCEVFTIGKVTILTYMISTGCMTWPGHQWFSMLDDTSINRGSQKDNQQL